MSLVGTGTKANCPIASHYRDIYYIDYIDCILSLVISTPPSLEYVNGNPYTLIQRHAKLYIEHTRITNLKKWDVCQSICVI